MRTTLSFAILAGLFAGYAPASAQPAIRSDFDSGADGWRIADLTSTGPYVTPVGIYAVTWQASGGQAGPFVEAGDPSSNAYSFDAPAKFLGDLSAYTNGAFLFSLRSTHNNWAGDNVVVMVGRIGGASRALVATLNPLPGTNWSSYAIPLRAAAFQYDTKSGAAVSPADFRSVMTNVTALRVSAEYGSAVQETVGLDSVELVVRPRLGITRAAGQVVLSWPGWATHFQLEAATALPASGWSGVLESPVPAHDQLWITNAIQSGSRFYRLRRLD